jgi:beta-glucosidase
MGIEWSRLQSTAGAELNQVELDRYLDILRRLKLAGITPMVVLHHFTNPPWISQMGGWTNPAVVRAFVDYVRKLVPLLKEHVYIWNTFNEPDTYASLCYLLGGFPPCQKWQLGAFRKVIRHMAEAHIQSSQVIRQHYTNCVVPEVGIAKNWTVFGAYQKFAVWDQALAAFCHHIFNEFVVETFMGGSRRTASTYLGLNYYGRSRFLNFQPMVPAGGASAEKLSRLGIVCDDMVERYPVGLGLMLEELYRRYQLPIYLTEHGAASTNSEFRIHDLNQHLQVLEQTMKKGVDVRGFFYWSLLDNFEWQFGYSKKFGLYAVDFADETLPRKITAVGEFYRQICQSSLLKAELPRQKL